MNMENVLNNLDIPTLQSDKMEDLEHDFDMEEISRAIMAMKSAKSPGLDSYLIDFLNKFKEKLVPILFDVCKEFKLLLGCCP